MSGAVKAVAGVVLIAVGELITPYSAGFGQLLVNAGASLLLNAAVQALGPKSPRAPPLPGIGVNYSGTLEPRRIIYGQLKVGGTNVLPPP